jgi:hypothetical protein
LLTFLKEGVSISDSGQLLMSTKLKILAETIRTWAVKMPGFFFGVRRQDGAFSGPAGWSALWLARRVAPPKSGDTSPHSKSLRLGHECEPTIRVCSIMDSLGKE